jgi:short-subunit dehydrogenase
MPVAGDSVLLTGAGSGIGRALAFEASKRGMKLALVGRRREALEETRRQLPSTSGCLIIPADVTVPKDRQLIRSRVLEAWGRLTLLINNAGIVTAGPLSSLHDDDLDRLIATNLSAPVALIRELLPLLCAGSPSRVVNIGSLAGDIALPLFAAYSATKFGLRGLSNALRRELTGFGIGVTYVAPRGVQTDAAEAVAHFTKALGMPVPDSAATVAAHIWDAVGRGADRVYPRGREHLFVLVERLLPAVITRALSRQLEAGGGRRLIADDAVPPAPDQPCPEAALTKGGSHVVES